VSLPVPDAASQLGFLAKLQRLFAEGEFTATYKFALLIALADLAVETGRDDGEPLRLFTRRIAMEFVRLYWQQSVPYAQGGHGRDLDVLVQNAGKQAAVISAIVAFRKSTGCTTFQAAANHEGFPALVAKVSNTVSEQPLRYLQNMAGATDPFLYERGSGEITLKPGVAYCLRRFQPLVQQLARSHWVEHVKRNRLNLPILGEATDLDAFLFETPRQALAAIGNGLRRLVGPRCFYCDSALHEADVDHFIPFAMYPRDLTHNFVLAHPACNRSKSDTLAARPHLERWLEHIGKRDDALREIGEEAGCVSDAAASRAVARWGYGNAMTSGGQAWIRPKEYEPINAVYLYCLA
jgi:5-methylcytosine-specific restriction endonuclease McrA